MLKKSSSKHSKISSQKLLSQIQKFPNRTKELHGSRLFDKDGFSARIARLIMHAYSAKSPEAKQILYEKLLRIIDEAKQNSTQNNLPDSAALQLQEDLQALESEIKKTLLLLSLKP